MPFLKYNKIYRIDLDEDTRSILGESGLIVTEKLDGCNLLIWKDGGKIHVGKRTQELPMSVNDHKKGMFSEVVKWVENTNWDFLPEGVILYGEGLKGKEYGKDKYKTIGKIQYERKEPFVLFDVFDFEKDFWFSPESKRWKKIRSDFKKANGSELPQVPVIDVSFELHRINDLNKLLGPSEWSENVKKEGVVVKKYYPDGKVVMVKLVDDEFKEFIKRKAKPKGSAYYEIVGSVVTKARVEKIMRKENVKSIKDFSKLIKAVVEDVFEEEEKELKELAWKNFKKNLGKVMPQMIKKHFDEITAEIIEREEKEKMEKIDKKTVGEEKVKVENKASDKNIVTKGVVQKDQVIST